LDQKTVEISALWRLHIAQRELRLPEGDTKQNSNVASQERLKMRKLLIISMVGLIPAFGCEGCLETMRRIEVWKAQTFFTPAQPVTMTPASSNPCGAPAAAPGCNCQQGAGTAAVMSTPAATVSAGYPADSGETVSTEELDGVLKQP
jgi:hypothetical protein